MPPTNKRNDIDLIEKYSELSVQDGEKAKFVFQHDPEILKPSLIIKLLHSKHSSKKVAIVSFLEQ